MFETFQALILNGELINVYENIPAKLVTPDKFGISEAFTTVISLKRNAFSILVQATAPH